MSSCFAILISMQLKANLHLHTSEDPEDGKFISYSAREAIDRAASLGFEVLALTLHNKCGYTDELGEYARQKNILLIPGIEKTIEGRHVLILNADKGAEQVQTFSALADYRAAKSDILVIAPHPYYYGNISVKEKLEQYHELFDVLEQSWFYKGLFDRNADARLMAERYSLPLIATSDLHVLSRIENSYAVIESPEKTVSAVLRSIRSGAFVNHSRPANWKDILSQVWLTIKYPGTLSLKKTLLGDEEVEPKPFAFVPPAGIEPASRP